MIKTLIIYTLLNLHLGGVNSSIHQHQPVLQPNSPECSQVIIRNSMGQIEKRKVCIPHLDLPKFTTKRCPDFISYMEGPSGCLLFYIKSYRDKEYTLVELLEHVHLELTQMRVDYV